MIVRGIVESKFKNQAKVRIPVFDKVYTAALGVDYDSLSTAAICVPPKFKMDIKSGDLVYVLFEENNKQKPVIIGYMFNENNSTSSANVLDLSAETSVVFSENTSIGDVTNDSIKFLEGIDKNLQEIINERKENVNINNNNNNNIYNTNNNNKNIILNSTISVNNANNNINYIKSIIGNNSDSSISKTLFGQLNFAKNYLNSILEKIGNVDLNKPFDSILEDYDSKIKVLEESIHNGKTYESIGDNVLDVALYSDTNVNKYETLYECIMYDSTCYRRTGKMNPVGILWHDTGVNNTSIKRYVQPSISDSNYNKLLNLIGKNQYSNDWNSVEHDVGVNAWIGKLADGSVATVQTLPWDYRPWGCGSGKYGSLNNGWIQFEICEDDKNNSTYFNSVYKEALKLTVYLCKKFNINPKGTVNYNGIKVPTIVCHWDSYKLGAGSGHYDVYDWFPKFGKCKNLTMEDVRNDVENILNSNL